MKKYSILLYPILSVGLIYGILALIKYFEHMRQITYNGSYFFINLALYALIGVVLTLEVFLTKPQIEKMKLYLLVERIVLIILLLFLTYYPIHYAFSPYITALLIGYEFALIGLSLLKKRND